MDSFTAHRLSFRARAETPILLNEHKGSAIRGALFHALRRSYCYQKEAPNCQECALHAACPVSYLVATVNEGSERGLDVPRPYTIEPPLGSKVLYEEGERFEFGLTLFSRALNLFPYIILAARSLEREGLGRKQEDAQGRWRRGTYTIEEVTTDNLLTGERRTVLEEGGSLVRVPEVPITHREVVEAAQVLNGGQISLHFLTPTRLIDQGRLARRPAFRILMQRLFERLSALARHFCDTPLELDFAALIAQAEMVELSEDETEWVELESYSTRLGRATPLGGFIGQAQFTGELGPFLSWLVWGQFTHVGKDAVKGNGWYEICT